MSQTLHPPGFVETADCNGPRYTRSQPSRETGGILLNECVQKYETQFELPYRNISNYVKQMQTNWGRLTDKDKEEVTRDFVKNVPSLSKNSSTKEKSTKKENFEGTQLQDFINQYLATNTNKNTKELMDALYWPDDTIKSAVSESIRDDVRKAINQWSDDQTLYYHTNYKTGLFVFLLIILFFLLGIGIMQSRK